MNILKILAVFLALYFPVITQAAIIPVYSINSNEVKEIIKLTDKNTLVIIALDNTITMPKAKIFLPASPYSSLIDSLITNSAKSFYYNKIIANYYLHRKLKLVEQGWPEFIQDLELRGANVFGMSDLSKVIYSSFKNPEIWKYNEVTSFGVNFTRKISNKELFQIAQIKPGQSIFYNGIIFPGPFTQSETLINFLKVSNLMPRKIIIFDSRIDRLKQMEYALRRLNLDYYSFHYKAINEIQDKVDNSIAKLQQETLLSKGIWLEDEEATALIQAQE